MCMIFVMCLCLSLIGSSIKIYIGIDQALGHGAGVASRGAAYEFMESPDHDKSLHPYLRVIQLYPTRRTGIVW